MLEGRALLSGIIAGGLMRARSEGFHTLEVNVPADGHGYYLPVIEVALGAKRYIVTISLDHAIAEEPEAGNP